MSPLCDGAGEAQRVSGHKKIRKLIFFCNISSLSGVKYADSPQGSVHGGAGAGGRKGVAPLNKGLSPQVTGGGQTGIVISTEQSEWRNL